MKKLTIIAVVVLAIALVQSCSDVKRHPSRVYMADMANSRAVETFADYSDLRDSGIFYNAIPVSGTVKRNSGGSALYYQMAKDTTGLYNTSAAIVNPLPALGKEDLDEAERIYLVNCGICHGQDLKGNGPLYKGGEGPYPAAPKNLVGPDITKMADGTMFHSITYGKNLMGSYASQVNPKQRWMIIHYIRSKQKEANPEAAVATPPTAQPDSAVKPVVTPVPAATVQPAPAKTKYKF